MKAICSICLDEVGDSLIAFTNCGHIFDEDCASRCLQTSSSCPICRKQICLRRTPYHRVYLTTENDTKEKESKELKELKEQLQVANELVQDFQNELEETYTTINSLQKDLQRVVKISNQNTRSLSEKCTQTEAATTKLKLSNKKLEKKLKTSEESCTLLKEQIKQQSVVSFRHTLLLTNKSNCTDCKKLAAGSCSIKSDWAPAPEDLSKLSRTALEKQYHALQEENNCLLALRRELSVASAGLMEHNYAKTYTLNLESQLRNSLAKEIRLNARLEANEAQQQAKKDMVILKREKNKLETDLNAMKEAKNLLKATLQTSLETNRVLQRQKQDYEKEKTDLQKSLTIAKENTFKIQELKQSWLEENRSLQNQLKSSKKRTRKLQNSKTKILAENQQLQEKISTFAGMFFDFGESLREFFIKQGKPLDPDWPLSSLT